MKKEYYENACIYMWRNKLNNKVYIGQTVNEKLRYNKHIKSFNSTSGTRSKFYAALKKYGLENFEYQVLEYISGTKEEIHQRLDLLERKYIKIYNSVENGYNLTNGGQSAGKIFSKEYKLHLCDSHIGQIPWNKGLTLSAEHKRHLSESHIGLRPWNKGMHNEYIINTTEEGRKNKAEKLRKIRTGIKMAEETKEKISIANKERYLKNPESFKTPEHAKELLRLKNLGKTLSLETRKKMSEAKKGKIPWNKGLKKTTNK